MPLDGDPAAGRFRGEEGVEHAHVVDRILEGHGEFALAAHGTGEHGALQAVLVTDGKLDHFGAAAGEVRHLRATVQSGAIDQDALTVQILHGPLARDGSFDPARLTVDAMQHVGDGRYEGSFTPTGAGRWGLTVRALPTHPGLSSIFETGLVAVDGR